MTLAVQQADHIDGLAALPEQAHIQHLATMDLAQPGQNDRKGNETARLAAGAGKNMVIIMVIAAIVRLRAGGCVAATIAASAIVRATIAAAIVPSVVATAIISAAIISAAIIIRQGGRRMTDGPGGRDQGQQANKQDMQKTAHAESEANNTKWGGHIFDPMGKTLTFS